MTQPSDFSAAMHDAALWVLAYIEAHESGDREGQAALVESIGPAAAIDYLAGSAGGSMQTTAEAMGIDLRTFIAAMRSALLRAA